MTASDWIAISALLVSIFSVLTSIYLYQKDRGRLRARANLKLRWSIRTVSARFGDSCSKRWTSPDTAQLDLAGLPADRPPWNSTSRRLPLKLERAKQLRKRCVPLIHSYLTMRMITREIFTCSDTLGRVYPVKGALKVLREYQRIYKDEIERWRTA